MPLKTFVKVGSISNLSDARYCAGMGVDMLGFQSVEGHDNYIRPAQFQEIRGWVTGPLVAAEVYGLKDPHELTAILENYKPDYLEMGLQELTLFSTLPLPLVLSVQEDEFLENLSVKPKYLLSKKYLNTSIPLLIEASSKEDVKSLLNNELVKGFALKGTKELKPGLKDYKILTDVLELLESED